MSKTNHLVGKSILELMWEDMDDCMEILMAECTECGKPAGAHNILGPVIKSCPELALDGYELEYSIDEHRGRAQGVAYAISLMQNPYVSDVDAVRRLAKERWNQRMAGEPVTPLKTRPETQFVG